MAEGNHPRVTATAAALVLIAALRRRHGRILFHQSGGCCDGSSPMCYPAGEFSVDDVDVQLGEIGGVPFFMSRAQFEYWQHTQLIIDVVPGQGGMFSLENGSGLRFLTRSRLFTHESAGIGPVVEVDEQSVSRDATAECDRPNEMKS